MQSQKIVRPFLAKTCFRRKMSSYGGHGDHHVTTMNDFPTPQGSWQTQYDANQRKYNAHLALGIGFAVVSVIFAKATGLVYLNANPPARPADPPVRHPKN